MNETDTTRTLLLARFPVFAEVPPARLDELLAAAPLRRVPAGSVLFEPNMPCEGFPLVLEGSVRVLKASAAGREIVLYRVSPGEACILSGSCLLGQNDYAARGLAECEVTLLKIPPAHFQELILQVPPFRRFVFDMYGARLAEVMELIEEVAIRKLDTRLDQPRARAGERRRCEVAARVLAPVGAATASVFCVRTMHSSHRVAPPFEARGLRAHVIGTVRDIRALAGGSGRRVEPALRGGPAMAFVFVTGLDFGALPLPGIDVQAPRRTGGRADAGHR